MSDYFGFPNMANIPNPSEWKHADTAKDWAEKANDSATLAKNYAEQVVENVNSVNEHVQRMDEHITDVTAEILTAAQTATTKAAQAATSESNASASATAASTSATSAATSASSAADSATSANTYKNTAQSAATDAVTAKTAAQTAATTATTKAAEAASSATDAATAKSYAQQIATAVESSVEEAETYATNAQAYANAAGTHADEAETSAQLADTKATAATASANAAAASVTQAQQVVSTASAYAAQAQTQATNAATSATAASTSATSAATSATSASESADDAAESATAAAASAETSSGAVASATASATAAATSATSASNSATTANTFMASAAESASEAAASAAAAASSAATCDTNEFTPTGAYNDNGPGRNRQIIDKLMITEEPGTEAREEYNIDNYKVSYYYTTESNGKNVPSFNGYVYMRIWIESGLFRITAKNRGGSSTISVDFKDVCVCIPAENPITSVSIDSNVLAATDYTVISNKSRNFIIISSSQTGSVLAVNYTGAITNGASAGVLHKTTVKATNPTTKLFSANSALDTFNFRVKKDHRVRVHINLPYRDHMNDNDGFNHDVSGFGFSGGNFCPDSDMQYGSVNRYAGVGMGRCTNGDVGVSSFIGGPSTTNNSYDRTINLSNGTTSTLDSYGTQMFGRLHTGWCSWVLPGFLNVKNIASTAYTYNSAMMCRAYSKLFVPVASDLTEDSIPILDGLNDTMYNGSDVGSAYSKLSAYNSHNVTRYDTYNCVNGPNKGHEAFKYYLIPGCLDVNGTTVKNPELPLYAGMQFWFPTNNASPTRTSYPHYFTDATDGITDSSPTNYSTSYLSSRLDYKSPNGSAYWHSNPLIGEAPGERNVFGNSYGFESRFLYYSDSNSTRYRTDNAGMHNTLGIRYFDAEAQEWRVFSPGDNCSYGYDGTHWNYREYLWVDLDKPVTYIVGGVNSSFQSSDYFKVDWSTYSNLSSAQKAMPAANVYGINSYGVASNAEGLTQYRPKDDFAPGTKVSDLIHVKTPNYENYTSYSKWRKLTMMTVDYSSSPLNENNTIYCADSAFGAEDTGVLDMTKVSCMYGLHSSLATYHVINNVYSNLFGSTNAYYDGGVNLATGNTATSIECNPIQYNTRLMVANNDGPISNVSYGYGTGQNNLEHTCYHIRIGLES